jgi:hypothetical protein
MAELTNFEHRSKAWFYTAHDECEADFDLVCTSEPGVLPSLGRQRFSPRPCLYVRGRRVPGRGNVRAPVPQGANLAECDHLDLCGDNGRRAACDVFHAPSARFDGMRNTCGRGLGACGIRALGGWTARDAGMGARTNEFVPDHVRTRRYRDRALIWGSGVANAGPSLTFAAAAVFALTVLALGFDSQSTSPPKQGSKQRQSTRCMISPRPLSMTTDRSR